MGPSKDKTYEIVDTFQLTCFIQNHVIVTTDDSLRKVTIGVTIGL